MRVTGERVVAELEDAELTEDRAAQLDAEHSPVRMQLDEKDTKEHLAKDCERNCATRSLRSRFALRSFGLAAQFKKTAAAVSVSSPPRPDLRNSTVYPSPSVFASSRYGWSAAARSAASPTPSVVSVAPTLGDDG
ncbi:hypothetical protein EDB89DRAFT_575642 [Lactarius sanguifluus]|nr:hypothetical protein EDB89DRAFT_575642 [Lactarius sanguifluus]